MAVTSEEQCVKSGSREAGKHLQCNRSSRERGRLCKAVRGFARFLQTDKRSKLSSPDSRALLAMRDFPMPSLPLAVGWETQTGKSQTSRSPTSVVMAVNVHSDYAGA